MTSTPEQESPQEEAPSGEQKLDLPPGWELIDFGALFEEGWKPSVRTKKSGRSYIRIRYGNKEKSLGPYTQDKWRIVNQIYDTISAKITQAPSPAPKKHTVKSPLFRTPLRRNAVFGKSIVPSLTTLRWFEILKENGYPGDMSDFINDIIAVHFTKCNGLMLPIVEKLRPIEMEIVV